MVLGLKFQPPTHHISQTPFSNPNRTPQTTLNPLFRVKPIETHSFPHLHLKLRIKNPNRFKSESSNSDGGGGGGGAEYLTKDEDGYGDGDRYGDKVWRFYLRFLGLLLRSDRENVGALGLSGSMAWVCAQVARLLFLVFVEIIEALMEFCGYMCVGAGVIFGVGVALIWLWF